MALVQGFRYCDVLASMKKVFRHSGSYVSATLMVLTHSPAAVRHGWFDPSGFYSSWTPQSLTAGDQYVAWRVLQLFIAYGACK